MIKRYFIFVTMVLLQTVWAQSEAIVERRVEKLNEELSLSAEQQNMIKYIYRQSAREMAEAGAEHKGDYFTVSKIRAEIKARERQQIENVLDESQKALFRKMRTAEITNPEALRLVGRLNLNDYQAVTVQKILNEKRQYMESLRNSAGNDRSAMRSSMLKLTKDYDKKIEALLTPEQIEEYRQYIKENRKSMRDNGGMRGGKGSGGRRGRMF